MGKGTECSGIPRAVGSRLVTQTVWCYKSWALPSAILKLMRCGHWVPEQERWWVFSHAVAAFFVKWVGLSKRLLTAQRGRGIKKRASYRVYGEDKRYNLEVSYWALCKQSWSHMSLVVRLRGRLALLEYWLVPSGPSLCCEGLSTRTALFSLLFFSLIEAWLGTPDSS